ITRCELVGNWLYGVAYRTALQARSRLSRRHSRELQVKAMPQPAATADYELHELHCVLDRELSGLPDKYRTAIVLYDLEGRSRREVATRLSTPEGTISSRLAQGRQLLARRLARHGFAISAGALATTLAGSSSCALVSTRYSHWIGSRD